MKRVKWIIVLAALPVILVLAGFFLRAQQVCHQDCQTVPGGPIVGYNSSYTCSDPNHPEYCYLSTMSGITVDSTGGLHLRLNQIGANFVPSSNYPVSTNWRMTGAAADFNGDGYVDLAEGGRQCDDHNYVPGDTNLSIFFSQGKDLPSNPTKFKFLGPYYINYLSTFTTFEIMALGTGDYDGDGDVDIAALSWQGRLWIFWNRYVEDHRPAGYANSNLFSATPTAIALSPNNDLINDGYGEFGSGSSHFRWESNIASADVNGDSKVDLIVGIPTRWATSRWGEVVIYINNGSGTFSRLINPVVNPGPPATKIPCNPYPNNDTYLYGVCGVAAGKFRGSSQPVDFIVGTAGGPSSNPTAVYYYRNDGLGNFTLDSGTGGRSFSLQASRGTLSFFGAGDLENDGSPDLVLSTDGAHYGWQGGYVYWYENQIDSATHQPTGHFTMNCVPTSCARVSSSGDLDSGALGDFDYDGDIDFFVADGNNSANVYFFMNETLPLYIDTGTVDSKNRIGCGFITSENAIVAATLTHSASIPSGTSITYYLSNSDNDYGDPKWEGPVTPGTEFCFESPGVFLRWRAVLTTQPPPNNTATPRIYSITLNYRYITKREYSRTSQAYTTVEINSSHLGDEDVLYAASFEFPTWKGHLRSWDVTNLTLAQNKNSQLADILDVGATFGDDAGEILRTRDYSTRIVYTAYDLEGDGIMNNRLDFNVSQKDILDNFLGLGEGSPEAELLIKFVLGDTRDWKLGDINHSSPQALNPPNGDGAMMGDGYSEFVTAKASRPKVVLVGANDGMLHCFDAATMEELWAFIPNNLLYKLMRMRVTDEDCGVFLQHQFFVDGTPAIQDVFFAGAWHTVLVCGQGPGWGKNNKCYYFALDVTDPLSPLPLWEFTHDTMGETWSVPVIGNVSSENKWIAFFGSGYDNDPDHIVGNTFYAVDVQTGSLVRAFAMVESPEPASPFGIQNTLPGSPSEIDSDRNGYINAVYIGDLLGRLWKLEVSTLAAVNWAPAVLYSDPFHQPIITKPEIGIDMTNKTVRVYFGTGGDEKATNTAYYSFIALKDVSPATVEWYMGNQTLGDALGLAASLKKDDLAQGEKVWADPVISNNLIYIATLYGSIESLNPCLTLPGVGKIYSRYVSSSQAGTSALLGSGGEVIAYLQTKQKVRSAVTVGNTQKIGVGSDAITKSKVFIQSYTRPEISPPEPPSQVLAQPVPPTQLVIKSWREVYRIFR
jgi:hypothetical protein